MTTGSNVTAFPVEPQPLAAHATQPLLWSVRREVWENRWLYFAPLIVAAVVLLGLPFSLASIVARRRALVGRPASEQIPAIFMPYDGAALMIIATALLVALFYCIESLYGERRDRSILFWKSLPVSDRTSVLAKAAIPLLVLPLITFVVTVATQFAMLVVTSGALYVAGVSPSTTWTHINLFVQPFILFYGLAANALWHAPLFGWLMLISAWSRRAAFVWALLPLLVFDILARMVHSSSPVPEFLRQRVVGGIGAAFDYRGQGTVHSLAQLTPGRFVTHPGLWLGLAFAALCLAAASHLRRHREPI